MDFIFENIFNLSAANWFFIVLTALLGYLLGSINFPIIITKKIIPQADIRTMGSGNAGSTNVMRSVGRKPAIFALLGDIAKGIVAVLCGKFIFSFCSVNNGLASIYGEYLAGFFCIIGHLYPCFFKFKGGKGVATLGAVICLTNWQTFLIVFGIALIIFFRFKIVSLAAIIGTILYPISTFLITYFFDYKPCKASLKSHALHYVIISTMTSFFISLIILYRHKENIKRIIKRQEGQIKRKIHKD